MGEVMILRLLREINVGELQNKIQALTHSSCREAKCDVRPNDKPSQWMRLKHQLRKQ